jgi:hypothetical protein
MTQKLLELFRSGLDTMQISARLGGEAAGWTEAQPICSIPNCGNPHLAKGYCDAHYRRLRRHGDPLAGRTTPGEPLRFIHEVAILHTGDDCLTWPFSDDGHGYGCLKIKGKTVRVSRYICTLVRGTPPTAGHEAAHNCGKGHLGCITPGHLEWKTSVENKADKLIHDTHNRGERHGKAKLTDANALQIMAMKGVESQYELAKRFGVSQKTVSEIHHGRRWSWLFSESPVAEVKL